MIFHTYKQWCIYHRACSSKFEECILLLTVFKNGLNIKKLCLGI